MTIEEKIQGTSWRLVSYQSETNTGEINYPLGDDAEGVIIFTPDNRLSVHIMAADREAEVAEEVLATYNTEAEKDMARLGYHSYSGPFDLNEDEATLTTHVELSLIPSYVGSDQTRSAKIDGDTLHLSNVKHPERKLVWKKITK